MKKIVIFIKFSFLRLSLVHTIEIIIINSKNLTLNIKCKEISQNTYSNLTIDPPMTSIFIYSYKIYRAVELKSICIKKLRYKVTTINYLFIIELNLLKIR